MTGTAVQEIVALEDSLTQATRALDVDALDRIYARGLKMIAIEAHDSRAARRASDHLPVVALVKVDTERAENRA